MNRLGNLTYDLGHTADNLFKDTTQEPGQGVVSRIDPTDEGLVDRKLGVPGEIPLDYKVRVLPIHEDLLASSSVRRVDILSGV
ncbi:hypothetical protein ES705_31838 [subsurface metagenome]